MEKTKIIKKTRSPYITSVSFLVFILVITFWLNFYNNSIKDFNSEKENSITWLKNIIEGYKNNEELNVYSLIQTSKNYLDKLHYNSKITDFLTHMNYIKEKYDLDFRWFVFNWEVISTSVMIESDEYSDTNYKLAYQKVVDFISKYREDHDALFELEFVDRIVWYDEMKFDVDFKIKKIINN